MKHCTTHCRACGRHFTGTRAFDRHRVGPHDDRRCEMPTGKELVKNAGDCSISSGETEHGVTVYSTT